MFKYTCFINLCLLCLSCSNTTSVNKQNSYKDVKWQLISFDDTIKLFQKGDWLWIDAEFLNENDSVFWSSHHEGADKFFIQLSDTVQHPFFYPFYFCSEQDSLFISAPKSVILKDIFNTIQCPYFLKDDKELRAYIKIRKRIQSIMDSSFNKKLQADEVQQIQMFLEKNQVVYEIDDNGIIWIEPLPIPNWVKRMMVREATVAYTGYFLDGRVMDHSDSLGIRYNDTLQLIEGLNYVIKKLEVGQSAKIILPSQLAFGDRGSFNKTVPPFTPLLYEIKLMQIQ